MERWADEFEVVAERMGPRVARSEPRRRAVGHARGRLGDAERKNGWQVAEHLGDPDGVLVVDKTGFLKTGTKSCGVARQDPGTAGRIENARVGVSLGCAGAGAA